MPQLDPDDPKREYCLPKRRGGRKPDISQIAGGIPVNDRTADQIGRSYTREQIEKFEDKRRRR